MQLEKISRAIVACSLTAAGWSVQAADFTFQGHVNLNTDIVQVGFTVNTDATNVDVWTDSFMGGVNYDPITALWRKVGSDYQLIDENDDNPDIRAGQTYYDSGFHLATLAAGDYLFTVGAYPNFAYGTLLSQGFEFDHDGTTPVAIPDWCQPDSRNNCLDQKGTFWRVNLSGVDSATPPPAVPEPSTCALMALGLGVVGWAARRRKQA